MEKHKGAGGFIEMASTPKSPEQLKYEKTFKYKLLNVLQTISGSLLNNDFVAVSFTVSFIVILSIFIVFFIQIPLINFLAPLML